MRIIVFSSLFPSAEAPNAGTFIRERMFRVARHVPLLVVAPVAWSPFDWMVRYFWPGFRPMPVRQETMDGIEVYRPRYFSLPGALKRLDGWLMVVCCYPALRRLRAGFRPSLIDGHFLYPDGFAAVKLGRWLGIPVTVSIRGSKDQRLMGTPCEAAMRWTLKHAAGVMAVSDQLVADVAVPLGLASDRVAVVGNGVDLARFVRQPKLRAREQLGIDPQARVLAGVGNLIELKGFHRVIALLPRLREKYPGLLYLIVGGSAQQADQAPALKSLAAELGVADIVRFCGPQPQRELAWFYSAADLFVLATAYEGWANVFLEAMACGCPVVTTRVGGNAQVVASSEVGALVPYWNPEAFLAAIAEGLERDWNEQAILDYAAEHSWDVRIEALLEKLAQAIDLGTDAGHRGR